MSYKEKLDHIGISKKLSSDIVAAVRVINDQLPALVPQLACSVVTEVVVGALMAVATRGAYNAVRAVKIAGAYDTLRPLTRLITIRDNPDIRRRIQKNIPDEKKKAFIETLMAGKLDRTIDNRHRMKNHYERKVSCLLAD